MHRLSEIPESWPKPKPLELRHARKAHTMITITLNGKNVALDGRDALDFVWTTIAPPRKERSDVTYHAGRAEVQPRG